MHYTPPHIGMATSRGSIGRSSSNFCQEDQVIDVCLGEVVIDICLGEGVIDICLGEGVLVYRETVMDSYWSLRSIVSVSVSHAPH